MIPAPVGRADARRTVLVADPNMTASISFATLLRGSPWTFAGTVSNGKGLLDAVARLAPWAVVIDLGLPDHPATPGVGWALAAETMAIAAPGGRVAVSCDPSTRHLVLAAQSSGARAWVEKPYSRGEILAALSQLESAGDAPRHHPRARRVARPLPCRWGSLHDGPSTARRRATIGDLSESGLLFRSVEEIEIGAVVGLEFDLPGAPALRLQAQVVRRVLSRGEFALGAVFVGLADALRDRIAHAIARLLASEGLAPAPR